MKHPTNNPKPIPGRVFKTERGGHEEYYQVVHSSNRIVVLMSNRTHRNTDEYVHRFERRKEFDRQVESGRFDHVPDTDVEFPDVDILTPDSGDSGEVVESGESDAVATEKNRENASINTFGSNQGGSDNRKPEVEDEDDGKSTTETSESEDLETNKNNSSTPNSSEKESSDSSKKNNNNSSGDSRVDWTDVETIGKGSKKKLYEAGYTQFEDVRSADVDELKNVTGVGPSGAEFLKDFVRE